MATVSYYTRVTFEFSDDPPSVADVSKIVKSWLETQKFYAVEDVLGDFVRGWTKGQVDFSDLVSQDIEGIMACVSAHYPEMSFYVRGMGEEFKDVWLRQFEGGKAVFTLGPFEEIGE